MPLFQDQNAIYSMPHAVPASADSILERALAAQDTVRAEVAVVERGRTNELEVLAGRAHLTARQQSRRINRMEKNEDRAVEQLKQGVESVRQALRDTPSTLRPDGHQAHSFANRDVYEGEWRNSNLHGRGKWVSPEAQLEYDGEWFLGARAGQGRFHCKVTDTYYAGRWYEGKRHGKGELTEAEGTYRGEFRDHRFHGVGEYVYGDGHKYRGEWADDRFDGTGTYTFPSGAKYDGEWSRGLLEGKGTAHYDKEGTEVYTGEWSAGKRHGRGVHRAADFVYSGEWEWGARNGTGTCQWADGSVYEGEFWRGQPHGEGTMQLADHATYSGEWSEGRRHGRGVYTAPSERASFDGTWVSDKKHGPGVLTVRIAGSLTGTWVDDELHGRAVFRPLHGEPADAVYRHGECVACVAKEVLSKVTLSLTGRRQSTTSRPVTGVKPDIEEGNGDDGATAGV
jgi:hypothetical protein